MKLFFLTTLAAVCLAAEPAYYPNCAQIQRAIDALPAEGGVVELAAGLSVCDAPLVITRDNVTLRGAGRSTILWLAGNVNQPVLVVGSPDAAPVEVRRGVTIRDLAIDGNSSNQPYECADQVCAMGALRANALTIRHAEDVAVENVALRNARSGGLVTEFTCRRIRVSGLNSEENHWDGVALYETEDSSFSGLYLSGNKGAGISADVRFRRNTFNDVVVRSSGKVGLFLRDSTYNLFSNLHVHGSGEHGLFLAQVDTDAGTPAAWNVFQGLRVESNAGAAVRIANPSCVENVIGSAVFTANAGGCLVEEPGAATKTGLIVCR